ncbi:MAG: hypothetical protein HQM03_10795 [Magnetococcales bacterium]|nr:hypothetical protein [Magnetococcales bacterium]
MIDDKIIHTGIGGLIAIITLWIKEYWSLRTKKEERQNRAKYFAIRLVCVLDQFVSDCTKVAFYDGLIDGHKDSQGCLDPNIPFPKPPHFSDSADDWLSINYELMYDLHSLPPKIADANKIIEYVGEWNGPPFDVYIEEAQYQYAILGLFAADLAQRLRKAYEIPDQVTISLNTDWDMHTLLRERIEKYQQRRSTAQSCDSPLTNADTLCQTD